MGLNGWINQDVQKKKKRLEEWMVRHNAELPFPESVKVIKDVPYMDDGQACHLMDIYCPKNMEGNLPVIVNAHGGGLLFGTKEVNTHFCARLCEMGFLVFCVEYPLITDVLIYDVFADINKALDKVDSLLDTYGGDRERVFLTGDSAGAYLFTYTAAMQRCQEMADAAKVTPTKLPIKALGLLSGMFYTHNFDSVGIFLTGAIYGRKWRKHPFRPYMNPEHKNIIGNLPPCFLMTSEGDFQKQYTLSYYKALKEKGMTCKLLHFPANDRLVHAFSALFPEYEESKEANEAMAAYFLQC